jgi:hypothetical protein
MALTDAQKTTLAAHIRANTDPDVVAALLIRNDTEMARLYNLDSTFIVWKPTVSVEDYRDALDWTEVDNITAAKARIWEWATGNMTLPLETGKANVRAGLAQAWASNSNTRPNLLAVAMRPATVAESIWATGTGTTQTPGDLEFEYTANIQDVGRALNDNP